VEFLDARDAGDLWPAFHRPGRASCGRCRRVRADQPALTVETCAQPALAKLSGKRSGREGVVVVAISGLHGAGKTTAARALVRKFRLEYVSAGTVFRQMAKERGMTLEAFSRYAERYPKIDRQIDRRTARAAMGKNVLVDARLAGWMAKGANIRILLTVPLEVRVRRIAKREGRSYKEVLAETVKRERSEAKRFKRFYSIDVDDWSVFDIVLNTERFGPREMTRVLELAVESIAKRR